jgi:hypothetical protein
MSVVVIEQATVYRAGGRRWFTRRAAIKAYAHAKFKAKHPCECERGEYSSGYPGYECGAHDHREKVMPRYLRWLKRHCLFGTAANSHEGYAPLRRKVKTMDESKNTSPSLLRPNRRRE